MPVQSIDLSAVSGVSFNGSTVDKVNLNGSQIWQGSKPFKLMRRLPIASNRINPYYALSACPVPFSTTCGSATEARVYFDCTNGPLDRASDLYVRERSLNDTFINLAQHNDSAPVTVLNTGYLSVGSTDTSINFYQINVPSYPSQSAIVNQGVNFYNHARTDLLYLNHHVRDWGRNGIYVGTYPYEGNIANKPASNASLTEIALTSYYNFAFSEQLDYAINSSLKWNIATCSATSAGSAGADPYYLGVRGGHRPMEGVIIGTVNDDGTIAQSDYRVMFANHTPQSTNAYSGAVVPANWSIKWSGWWGGRFYKGTNTLTFQSQSEIDAVLSESAFTSYLASKNLMGFSTGYVVSDGVNWTGTVIDWTVANGLPVMSTGDYVFQRRNPVTNEFISGLYNEY